MNEQRKKCKTQLTKVHRQAVGRALFKTLFMLNPPKKARPFKKKTIVYVPVLTVFYLTQASNKKYLF